MARAWIGETDAHKPDRYAQLDALRAFAVLSVLVYHWLPGMKEYIHIGAFVPDGLTMREAI
jgi:peptidoglycan/LPS O-acetylase OafA/YrhL